MPNKNMKRRKKIEQDAEPIRLVKGIVRLFKDARTSKESRIILAILVLAVFLFVTWQLWKADKLPNFHRSTVTMRVISFNHSTGEISLEFNNKTDKPVPVSDIYTISYGFMANCKYVECSLCPVTYHSVDYDDFKEYL